MGKGNEGKYYMKRNIYLLDCTLRDGGFALESEKGKNLGFSEQTRKNIAQNLTNSAIDIIELGALEIGESDKKNFSVFHNICDISDLIPSKKLDNQIYAVFFRGPDIPIDLIPNWNKNLCRLIRLGVRYSEIDKSLEYCKRLCEKGYLVSVQPIVTMRYTTKDLDQVIKAANEMNAYSVYFVDSYGSMYTDDVLRILKKYNEELCPEIKIGFHAHNNMGLAASNVMNMISAENERDLIIDACCLGMGQGAGNLQTEVIVPFLNKIYKKNYDFIEVLKVCDSIAEFWKDNLWGYSVAAMIPAVYGAAYKYGLVLRNEYHYTYSQIAKILQQIPLEMKYRFTENNIKELLKGIDSK
jgi:4-hydroxy 2-oxovalerate aldolase